MSLIGLVAVSPLPITYGKLLSAYYYKNPYQYLWKVIISILLQKPLPITYWKLQYILSAYNYINHNPAFYSNIIVGFRVWFIICNYPVFCSCFVPFPFGNYPRLWWSFLRTGIVFYSFFELTLKNMHFSFYFLLLFFEFI